MRVARRLHGRAAHRSGRLVTRAVAAALALLGSSACAPEEPLGAARQDITGGAPDSGDPAVVGLVYGSDIRCTGTLIAPRVVLTAGHCLAPTTPGSVLFGQALDTGTLVAIQASVVHPHFDAPSLANDLGAVLLAEPAAVAPLTLGASPAKGESCRVVGFGALSAGEDSPPLKREGTALVSSVGPRVVQLTPDPSLPCRGDSGGPALDDNDPPRVFAVVSNGDSACATRAEATRVDAYLDEMIGLLLPDGGAAGDPCLYDDSCVSGECLSPQDSSFGYCTSPCVADDDCPPQLECVAGVCRHPLPSPGALGGPCTALGCSEGTCAARPSDPIPTCRITCNQAVGLGCASGESCVPNVTAKGNAACFEEPTEPANQGGCALGSAGKPGGIPGWAVLLISALIPLGRRARRRLETTKDQHVS